MAKMENCVIFQPQLTLVYELGCLQKNQYHELNWILLTKTSSSNPLPEKTRSLCIVQMNHTTNYKMGEPNPSINTREPNPTRSLWSIHIPINTTNPSKWQTKSPGNTNTRPNQPNIIHYTLEATIQTHTKSTKISCWVGNNPTPKINHSWNHIEESLPREQLNFRLGPTLLDQRQNMRQIINPTNNPLGLLQWHIIYTWRIENTQSEAAFQDEESISIETRCSSNTTNKSTNRTCSQTNNLHHHLNSHLHSPSTQAPTPPTDEDHWIQTWKILENLT